MWGSNEIRQANGLDMTRDQDGVATTPYQRAQLRVHAASPGQARVCTVRSPACGGHLPGSAPSVPRAAASGAGGLSAATRDTDSTFSPGFVGHCGLGNAE